MKTKSEESKEKTQRKKEKVKHVKTPCGFNFFLLVFFLKHEKP